MSDENPEAKEDEAPAPEAPPPKPEAEEPEAPPRKASTPQSEGPPPTPEELKELREKAARADEYLDLARRAKADFINYQDRVKREKQGWRRQALEGFIQDLLPALDGFALATFEDPKLVEALRVLEKELLRALAKEKVVPMDTKGKAFDPQFHEAVGVEEGGTVLQEVRRGWLIDGVVLRPASVRIVKPPAKEGEKGAPERPETPN